MRKEPCLIILDQSKKIIFVGDTHGDLEVSQKIIKEYLKPQNHIVFLGDYVDRGPQSRENLDFLLEVKEKNPDQIFLLQGNHEGYRFLEFSPAEFWRELSEEEFQEYSKTVENFPLAIATKDILALHGALPDVKELEDFNKIENGSENWFKICWGDFVDEPGQDLGLNIFSGRPQFGRDYFFKLMERFQKKVLIRSHDVNAPQLMFDDRCLTIFTSAAYRREKIIAIADLSKQIKTAKDLEIKMI